MPTIDQLKPEQLNDPEIFRKVKDLANPLILGTDSREAFDLINKLNRLLEISNLESSNPDPWKQYQDLIIKLKWAAIPLLSDEQAADLLRKNLLSALSDEYIDVENRIEAKMLFVPFLMRDNLRQILNRAIKENVERLGAKTIGEWITDYSRAYDIRERTAISHIKYISKTPKAQMLSSEEKDILRKILYLFDYYLVITPLVDYFSAQEIYKELLKEEGKKGRPPLPIRPPVTPPAPKKVPVKIEIEKKEKKPEPKPKPAPPTLPKIEEAPEEEEIVTYERRISPYERRRRLAPAKEKREEKVRIGEYQIRTMKQDIEKVKRQPIPEKPKPKIKNNIIDLSGR